MWLQMAGLTLFLMLHNTPFLFIGFRIFPVSRNWITGLTSLCWALVFLKYSGIWDCTEEYFSIAWSLPSPHPTLHHKETSPVFCLEKVSEYFLLFYRRRSETQVKDQSAPCPEKAMAPKSSTLAWKIPWMEEPGRL